MEKRQYLATSLFDNVIVIVFQIIFHINMYINNVFFIF